MAKSKWLKGAVKKSHIGFCTPVTKKTCTPARKAFAKRAKAHKLQAGGKADKTSVKKPPILKEAYREEVRRYVEPIVKKILKRQMGGDSFNFDDPASGYQNNGQEQQPLTAGPQAPYLQTPQGQQEVKRYAKMGYEPHVDASGKVRYTKKKQQQSTENPYVAAFNGIASTATGLGNMIQNNKLKQEEKLQMLQGMTPKFMTNMEGEGLNNVPAYTKYGGEPTNGAPVGVVDASPGNGLTDGMYDGNFRNDGVYGKSMLYSGEFKNGGEVTADKAKEILTDGTANGHPLTPRQKRYFGWIAGGKKQAGGTATALSNLGIQTPGGNAQVIAGTSGDPLTQGFNDLDYINYAAGKGINPYLDEHARNTIGKSPTLGQDFLRSLAEFSGRDDIKTMSPEQRVHTYFSLNENNPAVNKYKQRLNSMSHDAVHGFRTTPDAEVQSVQGNDLGARTGVASRKYGGKKYQAGGSASYNVGDEVELSDSEIKELKKQGYKFKNI